LANAIAQNVVTLLGWMNVGKTGLTGCTCTFSADANVWGAPNHSPVKVIPFSTVVVVYKREKEI